MLGAHQWTMSKFAVPDRIANYPGWVFDYATVNLHMFMG